MRSTALSSAAFAAMSLGSLGCAQVAGIEDVSSSAAAQHCVDTVNQLRATAMLAPVARWTSEEQCADESAQVAAEGSVDLPSCAMNTDGTAWGEGSVIDADSVLQSNVKGIWNNSPGHGSMGQASLTQVACGYGATATASGGSLFFDP